MAYETYKSTYTANQMIQGVNFSKTQIAEVFSTTATYKLNDFVMYNDSLYQCISNEAQCGEWQPLAWQIHNYIFDNDSITQLQGGAAPTDATYVGGVLSTDSGYKTAYNTEDDSELNMD